MQYFEEITIGKTCESRVVIASQSKRETQLSSSRAPFDFNNLSLSLSLSRDTGGLLSATPSSSVPPPNLLFQEAWTLEMERSKDRENSLIYHVGNFTRKCLFGILSVGPIPDHIAFIMDGNRRCAKKCNLEEGAGHKLGFTALLSMLRYCYELNVKYVTIYAFSIDNFKRRPEEVGSLMELIREKIEGLLKEDSIVNQYGIRVHFVGDLKLLDESVRLAAEKAMAATSGNSKAVLSICIAYTSTNEIVNAVQQTCEEKWDEFRTLDSCGGAYGLTGYVGNGGKTDKNFIGLSEIERNMFMRVAPGPDILIRTSGETRLSNFLLWQSGHSLLYSPSALWPQIGLRHLVWAVLNFQRNHSYLKRKKDFL